MTSDTWHVTHDMWHKTCDTWHVTQGGGWTFSQNVSSPALTVLDQQYLEDILTNHDLLNQWTNEWMNYIGDCRKALATPGLLKTRYGEEETKTDSYLKLWTCGPGGPHHIWGKILINPLVNSGRCHGRGVTNNLLKVFFLLQNSRSCPQAYCGGGCRLKLPINGAVDFLKKSDTTLKQSVLCHLKFLYR